MIALDLLVNFLWHTRIDEDVTMVFLNASAMFEDLKMLLDFALDARQAGNREAGEFVVVTPDSFSFHVPSCDAFVC